MDIAITSSAKKVALHDEYTIENGWGDCTYPITFAYSSRIVDISRPSQTECSSVEVAVREHVRQAERIIVVLRQQFEERLNAVVASKSEIRKKPVLTFFWLHWF